MYVDPITRADLNLFHPEQRFSVFHRLNFAQTDGGRDALLQLFERPLSDRKKIEDRQLLIQLIGNALPLWPSRITNGTLHAIEKWIDYPLDPIPASPLSPSNFLYRWLHPADHSMIRYSLPHLSDLYQGCQQILDILRKSDRHSPLHQEIHRLEYLLNKSELKRLNILTPKNQLSNRILLPLARLTRTTHRSDLIELIGLYYQFDAWYSMAKATKELNMTFPIFRESDRPFLQTRQLTHLQLEKPIGYDLELDAHHRLLFLTGANMAGKSTLIKSVGMAVYLAHLGMGVPALKMELSLFEGLLSNVTISDNVIKGESYFFNEVQRIKKTLEHMIDGRRWLVLIDELFKGTNVEDARRCSLAVIQGIIHIPKALTILSTHLYEIADSLKQETGILYRYFETEVGPETLHFSYRLKEGVSQDRIGYRILEREGITDLLQQIRRNIDE